MTHTKSLHLIALPFLVTCMFILTVVPADADTQPDRTECTFSKAGWSKNEISAWHDLCSTGEANLNDGELNASFVFSILSEQPFRTQITARGLRLRHAHIVNSIDLENAKLAYGISIKDSRIDGDLNLSSSTVGGSIVVVGTSVSGDVDHIKVTAAMIDLMQRQRVVEFSGNELPNRKIGD